MPCRTLYLVQRFKRIKGKLVEAQRVIFPSSQGAVARAVHDAAGSIGVVALQQTIDTETGEVLNDQFVLARFGELPAGMFGED